MNNEDKDFSSNKGAFVAIALCVALYLGWNQYLTRKYPNYGQPKTVPTEPAATPDAAAPQTSSAPSGVQASGSAPATPAVIAAPAATPMAPQDLIFDTKDVSFAYRQDLASPSSAKLKNYRSLNTPDSELVELFARPATIQAFAGNPPLRTGALSFTGERMADGIKFSRMDGPWKIDQQWIVPASGYAGKLTITYTNVSAEAKPLVATVIAEVSAPIDAAINSFFAPGQPGEEPRFLTQFEGSDSFKNLAEFCKDQTLVITAKNQRLDFFGYDTHYFAFALVPAASATYHTTFSGRATVPGPDNQPRTLCEITTTATSDFGSIAPKATATISYDVWTGPKEVELLSDFNPHLKTTLGLGWLDMIAHPLLLSIKGLHKLTGNYGLAIIVLTLLLKILFFPLTKQAAHSAAKMKKLNPEMARIKERYKGDAQKSQMEIMKFMSANKVNPMKGCLPILPTIPVFFALFRVLSASIDLRHAPFYGWIIDLSAKDPYLVTPIILTGFMFIQQKLTPMPGVDKTQEKVMMFMPLIFGVMMISLPSGLVLYMLTNTIVSIAQQQFLNKKFANI
jgi:YidC/Oxa1 family membrane protein insertase